MVSKLDARTEHGQVLYHGLMIAKLDAEFARAEFPTGDRPHGSDLGIQGGLFESWFEPGTE